MLEMQPRLLQIRKRLGSLFLEWGRYCFSFNFLLTGEMDFVIVAPFRTCLLSFNFANE